MTTPATFKIAEFAKQVAVERKAEEEAIAAQLPADWHSTWEARAKQALRECDDEHPPRIPELLSFTPKHTDTFIHEKVFDDLVRAVLGKMIIKRIVMENPDTDIKWTFHKAITRPGTYEIIHVELCPRGESV